MKKYCIIIPSELLVCFQEDNSGKSFDLGNGIILATSPAWIKSEHILKEVKNKESKSILLDYEFIIKTEFTFDDSEEKENPPNSRKNDLNDFLSAAYKRLHNLRLSIWLVLNRDMEFDRYFIFKSTNNRWEYYIERFFDKFWSVNTDYVDKFEEKDFLEVKKYNETIAGLGQKMLVKNSLDLMSWALSSSFPINKLFLMWSTLELLFSPSDRQELSFRISQRIAFFLNEDNKDRKKAEIEFKKIRKCYNLRSKYIHGNVTRKQSDNGESEQLQLTEEYMKKSVIKILGSEKLVKIFESKKKDDYLEGLVYEGNELLE